ncbi:MULTISPECIES: HAD family hydrolase [Nocardiopsis]|uniref:Phosphatase n=1 Tax=Nocardiopsis sinuspersici TaxID=501010 RepID=A0A1V3C264_9ACTN|nr:MULTISPECIES: HAD hydrolase-like protein [Nocardiopsis]NYH51012.1 phosphoglycolate phosphatase-like HAD superfamily hydrolase [Nocardiopsis sinuspersici]OOC54815.1 phosphatase [Nocardiopsis sinuspersici]
MAETNFDRHDITHIVWDWNGTLLDDNHANLAAVNAVCELFGRDPVEMDYWRSVFRRPLVPCYEELLGRALEDGEWKRVEQLYDSSYLEHLPSCELTTGVPDVLHEWARGGGTQSLLSMAAHDHLVPLITERGLVPHFTRVDGRQFETEDDSKTEHLVRHLDQQGIDPSRVVLVGDIDDDARAAREAGARSVLVATGLMSRDRLEATGSLVVDSPVAAVAALRGA